MSMGCGGNREHELDLVKTSAMTSPFNLLYPRLLAHASVLRFLPERSRGVTPYYRDSIAGRLAAAEAQLCHHGQTKRLLEIGCGRDLFLGLVAAIRHGKEVVAFDVANLAELPLVNFTLNALGAEPVPSFPALLQRHGLRYVVAKSVSDLPTDFDGVASTAVLEHIPTKELTALVSFLARALRTGAVVTADVDYRDHWSFISHASWDHFLTLSDSAFSWINVPRMFQNRLRHGDVARLFAELGFQMLDETYETMELTLPKQLYADCFRNRSDDELRISVARVTWIRTDAKVPQVT